MVKETEDIGYRQVQYGIPPSRRLLEHLKLRSDNFFSKDAPLGEWFSVVGEGQSLVIDGWGLPVCVFEYDSAEFRGIEWQKEYYNRTQTDLGSFPSLREKAMIGKDMRLRPKKIYDVLAFKYDDSFFAGGRFSTANGFEVPKDITFDAARLITMKYLGLSFKEGKEVKAIVETGEKDMLDWRDSPARAIYFRFKFGGIYNVEIDNLGRLHSRHERGDVQRIVKSRSAV